MSRPRLHSVLNELFESKDLGLISCLTAHQEFKDFSLKYNLNIPDVELVKAFTHTSFSHEFHLSHQEQLEFLGDSVLQLILTEELFNRFPSSNEGHLSKLRSAIVNEKSLSTIAHGLALSELIIVGKGEFKKKLYAQETVLADTFEALLAQIYRYHGLEFTKNLFLNWLNEFLPTSFDDNFLDGFDAKSKLQEKILARYKKVPVYTSLECPNGFEVSLWINDVVAAKGIFLSKKNGEKQLAHDILLKGQF